MFDEYPFIIEQIGDWEKQLKEKIFAHLDKQDTLKATTLSDMPKGSGNQNQVEELVQKLIDNYVSEIIAINQRLDELNQKRREAESYIIQLTPTDYTIIKLRHFERKSFWDIGRTIHRSKTDTWRLHQDIIDGLKNGTYGTPGTINPLKKRTIVL